MAVIRKFARDVAGRFRPDRIILFGSHAYGRPHADSDVDILVVMKARNQLDLAVKIELACDPPFPLDIFVRTPQNLSKRLADGDSFTREIVTQSKVLYAKSHSRVGQKSGRRLPSGRNALARTRSSA
ncbi:MAG: nucleotidyltransferase domain-containing protein [Planctomycetes bacterium]|nr:nucleotidyltransferase domain-containing protein [Planctomycetota bacterium]